MKTAQESARDIDFAIDVTEPREVLLARFEAIITDALTAARAEALEQDIAQVAGMKASMQRIVAEPGVSAGLRELVKIRCETLDLVLAALRAR